MTISYMPDFISHNNYHGKVCQLLNYNPVKRWNRNVSSASKVLIAYNSMIEYHS